MPKKKKKKGDRSIVVRHVDPAVMRDRWPDVGEGVFVGRVNGKFMNNRRNIRRAFKEFPTSDMERDHWRALGAEARG